MFLLGSQVDLRGRFPSFLPLPTDAFDGDQDGREHTGQANDQRGDRSLFTAGFVESEVARKRTAGGADDREDSQRPGVVEPRHGGNDEPELSANEPQADRALRCGSDSVKYSRVGLRIGSTRRRRQRNHRRQCNRTSDLLPAHSAPRCVSAYSTRTSK